MPINQQRKAARDAAKSLPDAGALPGARRASADAPAWPISRVGSADALNRNLQHSLQLAAMAAVVEAKDEKAAKFYRDFDFIPL